MIESYSEMVEQEKKENLRGRIFLICVFSLVAVCFYYSREWVPVEFKRFSPPMLAGQILTCGVVLVYLHLKNYWLLPRGKRAFQGVLVLISYLLFCTFFFRTIPGIGASSINCSMRIGRPEQFVGKIAELRHRYIFFAKGRDSIDMWMVVVDREGRQPDSLVFRRYSLEEGKAKPRVGDRFETIIQKGVLGYYCEQRWFTD